MPLNWSYLTPIALLVGSNIFMTTAWYWHLRYKEVPLLSVIFISWGLAFIEYCLAVPANRLGSAVYSAAELKTMQEVITLLVFAVFSIVYLKQGITLNHVCRLRLDRRRGILRLPCAAVITSPASPAESVRRYCR